MANKHGNKRIICWPPFWNKVYSFEAIAGKWLPYDMVLSKQVSKFKKEPLLHRALNGQNS